MKRQLFAFLAGVLCMAAASWAGGGASAAEQASLMVDPNIQVLVEGQPFHPTDVNGDPALVFVADGTTYAPLRALAEAYGLYVTYDASTRTAQVTAEPPEEVPDEGPAAFARVLDVAPTGSLYVTRSDGSLWNGAWGDGYPVTDPEQNADGALTRVLPWTPAALDVGQWNGYALDEAGVLWGWGDASRGKLGKEGYAGGPIRIMASVRSFCQSGGWLLTVTEGDALWFLGTYGGHGIAYTPVELAENVDRASPWGAGALVLKTDGTLWRMVPTETDVPALVRLGEGFADVSPEGAVDRQGTLWDVGEDGVLQKILDNTVSTGRWGDRNLALDSEGRLWAWDGLNGDGQPESRDLTPQLAATHCRFPVCGSQPVYISDSGALCVLLDSGVKVLDREVVYAASGWYDVLAYIKRDGSLWSIRGGSLFSSEAEARALGVPHWTETAPRKEADGVLLPE